MTASHSKNVLVVYATNSGNTFFVAERVADTLREQGVRVCLQAVGETSLKDFDAYDTIIIGSCTWNKKTELAKVEEGQLQDQMDMFVQHTPDGALAGKKIAIFGLGDKDYQYFCRAADCLEQFVLRTDGAPIASTLRINGFPQTQTSLIDTWVGSLVKVI